MNIYLITEYIKKLTKEELNNFSLKKGINLNNKELDLIYNYIKKDYKTFIYGNPRPILDEIKQNTNAITYNKIETLYLEIKEKIRVYL